jgi:type II secretory pathway component PulJ
LWLSVVLDLTAISLQDAKEKGQGATALEARMATLRQRCAALEKSLEKEVARRERAEKEVSLGRSAFNVPLQPCQLYLQQYIAAHSHS